MPEAFEASPCPGAAWTDLDDAALRKYFPYSHAPGVLDQPGLTLEALATGQRFAIRPRHECRTDRSRVFAVWQPSRVAATDLARRRLTLQWHRDHRADRGST